MPSPMVVLAALLLTACAGPAANHVSATYTVHVESKGYAEINADWVKTYPAQALTTFPVFAWADVPSEAGGSPCTLHVPAPKDAGKPTDWEMKVWGHEMLHCVYGKWH